MITKKRREELHGSFWSETNELWTQEWRDELNGEESKIIREWDKQINRGLLRLCEDLSRRIKQRENNTE